MKVIDVCVRYSSRVYYLGRDSIFWIGSRREGKRFEFVFLFSFLWVFSCIFFIYNVYYVLDFER